MSSFGWWNLFKLAFKCFRFLFNFGCMFNFFFLQVHINIFISYWLLLLSLALWYRFLSSRFLCRCFLGLRLWFLLLFLLFSWLFRFVFMSCWLIFVGFFLNWLFNLLSASWSLWRGFISAFSSCRFLGRCSGCCFWCCSLWGFLWSLFQNVLTWFMWVISILIHFIVLFFNMRKILFLLG